MCGMVDRRGNRRLSRSLGWRVVLFVHPVPAGRASLIPEPNADGPSEQGTALGRHWKMRARIVLFAALIAAALAPAGAWAHEYKLGNLLIGHPWARATPGNATNGAAYLSVTNNGTEADRLIKADTPAAMAELHISRMDGGVMQMRPMDGLEIPPGGTVTLSPGGMHVMLMGLTSPLKQGDKVPMTLTFAKAGAVTVDVLVESVASNGPAGEGDMAPSHDHMHHPAQ